MPIDLAGQGAPRVGVEELGQAEVADLGDPVGGQEDVAGLEVAMDDPGLVGGVHGAGEGLDQRGGLARGHGLLGQPLGKAAAFGEFEREIRSIVVLADGVDGDDVRMTQPGDGVGLGLESLDLVLSRELSLGNRLDRHDAAKLLVAGLVDDAHAASTQLAEKLQTPRSSAPRRSRTTSAAWPHGRRSRHVRTVARVLPSDLVIDPAELFREDLGQGREPYKVFTHVGSVAPDPPDPVLSFDEFRRGAGRSIQLGIARQVDLPAEAEVGASP